MLLPEKEAWGISVIVKDKVFEATLQVEELMLAASADKILNKKVPAEEGV